MRTTTCADAWKSLRMLRRRCITATMTRNRTITLNMGTSARGRVTGSRLHPMPTMMTVASAAGMTGDQTTLYRRMQLLPATKGCHYTAGTVQLRPRRMTTEHHCSAGMAAGVVVAAIRRLGIKPNTTFERGSIGDKVQWNVASIQGEEVRDRGRPKGLGAGLGGLHHS